jgi:hypothetical protein
VERQLSPPLPRGERLPLVPRCRAPRRAAPRLLQAEPANHPAAAAPARLVVAAFRTELAAVEALGDPLTDPLEPMAVRPKKSQVTVRLCALTWVPHWQDAHGETSPAWT